MQENLSIADFRGLPFLILGVLVAAVWLFGIVIFGDSLPGSLRTRAVEFTGDGLYLWGFVGLSFLIGSMRRVTTFDPAKKTFTMSSMVLFAIPYWNSTYKFSDVRIIDLGHTGALTGPMTGASIFSSILSNLFFNSHRYSLLGETFEFESGEYELNLILQDRTTLVIYTGGSRKSLVQMGEAIQSLTGARLG